MNEVGWIMQSCEKLPFNETDIWIGAIASFPAFFGKTRMLLPVNNNGQHYWNTALESQLGISQNPTSISLRGAKVQRKNGISYFFCAFFSRTRV